MDWPILNSLLASTSLEGDATEQYVLSGLHRTRVLLSTCYKVLCIRLPHADPFASSQHKLLPVHLNVTCLQEEVRNILAATGKSGGISAEQILRQFNARRFAEASKAWSAAEGIAGSDPLDPLFFSPPSTPSYKNNPSSASQHQHSAPHGADPRSQDSGTAGYRSGFNEARGSGGGGGEGAPSFGRQYHRRPCAGGGWVC